MAADAVIEEQMQRLRRDLERQLARTAARLERAIESGEVSRDVETARRIGDEIADLLQRNFGVVSERFERASARVAEATLGDLGDEGIPETFTAQSAASLRAQVDGTLDDIATIGEEAAAELRTFIVDAVRSGVEPDLDALTAKLDGAAARALTLMDTGIASFDREVMTQQATEAGVVWFLYDGPSDDLTRPYCAERVGKRFTLESLDRVPNDTGPNPPSRYCGGWNCRHRLTPLLLEQEIAQYPEG